MNEWLIAALVLLVALVPAAAVAFRARPTSGLVSLQVAGSNATLILLLLSQGFGRQPFVDLALIAAVMSFIGSVVLAGFIEQGVE
jgi:multisubunit Na+/H+ antiporter MnhF subunit